MDRGFQFRRKLYFLQYHVEWILFPQKTVHFVHLNIWIILFEANNCKNFYRCLCASQSVQRLFYSACWDFTTSSFMENIAQTKASHWIMYLQMFVAIPGAIMSLVFGASRDRMGRKIIIAIPVIRSIINGFVLIIRSYFIHLDLRYIGGRTSLLSSPYC